MRNLENCGRLEVRESPIEGFGVFATNDIKAGTILEEVPFILFPRYDNVSKKIYETLKTENWVCDKELYMENLRDNLGFKHPDRYYFKWHPSIPVDNDSMYTVLPLGFGPIYNTSNTNNNADWKIGKDTFVFKAEKYIVKDEEIRTFYGYFLGNDGTIFHCEHTFHLAMDMFNGKHKVKMLRFGAVEHFNFQRNNPSALKFNTFISKSLDGVTIQKMSLIQSNGTIAYAFDVPDNITLTTLYQKLFEFHSSPIPIVTFNITYIDKETKVWLSDSIMWKK